MRPGVQGHAGAGARVRRRFRTVNVACSPSNNIGKRGTTSAPNDDRLEVARDYTTVKSQCKSKFRLLMFRAVWGKRAWAPRP
jgi:hypothetical protein